jgi:ATP-dependent Clp protease ATP-binding subunit ClpC
MRAILQKELSRVLERRGIRNREWAVEWESSALDFLLDRGFNAQMGARPLKRAIEQYVVVPLASNIVEHRFPSGEQFLFVRGTGDGIEVEFVDPDAKDAGESSDGADTGGGGNRSEASVLARIVLNPSGSITEREHLRTAFDVALEKLRTLPWLQLRESLLTRMGAADFWDQPDRARIHTHFALIDRVEAAARTATSLRERYERGLAGRPNRLSKDLANRLALQLFLVRCGVDDALRGPPKEVFLAIEPILEAATDKGSAAQWSAEIAQMYRSWAKARRMQIHEVGEAKTGSTVLAINGFGAEPRLLQEVGLHVLETESAGAAGTTPGRATARVSVTTRDLAESNHPSTPLLVSSGGAAARNATVVRRYRFGSAALVRDALANWRSGRVKEVMAGNFDLLGMVTAANE